MVRNLIKDTINLMHWSGRMERSTQCHDSITFYTIRTWISNDRRIHIHVHIHRAECICHSAVPADLTGRRDAHASLCQRRGARPSDQQITLNTNNHITLSADLYTALFKRPPLL